MQIWWDDASFDEDRKSLDDLKKTNVAWKLVSIGFVTAVDEVFITLSMEHEVKTDKYRYNVTIPKAIITKSKILSKD